jgi:hypothetical protein
MVQFVVAYDRASGDADVQEFEGVDAAERALEARFEAERSAGPSVEIATLTARSRAELEITHSRYFRSASDIFGDFDRLLAS